MRNLSWYTLKYKRLLSNKINYNILSFYHCVVDCDEQSTVLQFQYKNIYKLNHKDNELCWNFVLYLSNTLYDSFTNEFDTFWSRIYSMDIFLMVCSKFISYTRHNVCYMLLGNGLCRHLTCSHCSQYSFFCQFQRLYERNYSHMLS